LCLESGVCVSRVEALVMLDIHEDTMFSCCLQKGEMVFEGFDSGLGDHDMDLSLNCIESNWVVGCIWRENGDGITRREGIDSSFVGIGISDIVCGVRIEGSIETIIGLRYVLVKMLSYSAVKECKSHSWTHHTYCGKLAS
jgi:hypothetical protein